MPATPFPVSSDSNAFLNAADNAAALTSLGASPAIVIPDVAFIRSNGNDTTGDGSIAKPYLTAQKAIDQSFRFLDIGANCNAGDIEFDTHGTELLYVRGFGEYSVIEYIANRDDTQGYPLTIWDVGIMSVQVTGLINSYASGIEAAPGGGIVCYNVWCLGVASYGISGPPSIPQANGGNGGNITIYGPSRIGIDGLQCNGGDGSPTTNDDAPGYNGGNAGNITLIGDVIVAGTSVYCPGGAAGTNAGMGGPGSPGSDGGITLRQTPDIPTPTPNTATVCSAIINGVFYANSYP